MGIVKVVVPKIGISVKVQEIQQELSSKVESTKLTQTCISFEKLLFSFLKEYSLSQKFCMHLPKNQEISCSSLAGKSRRLISDSLSGISCILCTIS